METIKNFFSSVWDWITGFFDNLVDVLLYVPKWVLSEGVEALLAVINAIPVPGWMSNADGLFAGVSGPVMFFADVAQLGYGLSVLASAYGLRFVLRRIPFIGG